MEISKNDSNPKVHHKLLKIPNVFLNVENVVLFLEANWKYPPNVPTGMSYMFPFKKLVVILVW